MITSIIYQALKESYWCCKTISTITTLLHEICKIVNSTPYVPRYSRSLLHYNFHIFPKPIIARWPYTFIACNKSLTSRPKFGLCSSVSFEEAAPFKLHKPKSILSGLFKLNVNILQLSYSSPSSTIITAIRMFGQLV